MNTGGHGWLVGGLGPFGRVRRLKVGVVLAAGLAACGARSAPFEPAILLADPGRRVELAALIADTPMNGENIVRRRVSDAPHSTVFLVRIADREQLHRHTRYDLSVVVVEGVGVLWLDGVELEMGPGDSAHIPVGVAHYFINAGERPAAALAIFSPAFVGPDSEVLNP